MIVETEAVVLKTMKYRETSRIVTLYSREFGRLVVIAKGARERNNRFGSALNLMSYVQAVIYRKENRDLQLLSQCDSIDSFNHICEDMERVATGMAVVELMDAVTHAEERNTPLFGLLVQTLGTVNTAQKNVVNALYAFEVRLLDILGFRPNFLTCFHCGIPMNEESVGRSGAGLNVSSGGILCSNCSSRGMGMDTVSAGSVRMLQHLQEASDPASVTRITMSARMRNEVAGTMRRCLESHIEGFRPLKSENMFALLH
ncbi:MAG: repair protein RecO [Bacteroidetes bacterium]|jgi:DNA repair protein RecO (recombination protein O)|nr:repair protein RecO [Bacteroidota bacterium]